MKYYNYLNGFATGVLFFVGLFYMDTGQFPLYSFLGACCGISFSGITYYILDKYDVEIKTLINRMNSDIE